jgi:hypothetical protein
MVKLKGKENCDENECDEKCEHEHVTMGIAARVKAEYVKKGGKYVEESSEAIVDSSDMPSAYVRCDDCLKELSPTDFFDDLSPMYPSITRK